MNQGRVSVSYARALLGWATEHNCAADIYTQSEVFLDFIDTTPTFNQLLSTPLASHSKKAAAIERITTSCAPLLDNFIRLILKNRREQSLRIVLLMFQKLYRDHAGIVKVLVESAMDLTQSTRDAVRDYLAVSLGKTLEMEFRVKNDLMGGFVLTIDNNELDKSVRGELEKLRKKLLGFVLQQ